MQGAPDLRVLKYARPSLLQDEILSTVAMRNPFAKILCTAASGYHLLKLVPVLLNTTCSLPWT